MPNAKLTEALESNKRQADALWRLSEECVRLRNALEEASEADCGCSISTDASRGYPKEECEAHRIIDAALKQ